MSIQANFSPSSTNENEDRSHTYATWFIGFTRERLEARAGIEPAHKGFADLSLTTWVPRLWQGCLISALHIAVANPAGAGGRLERETRFELATLALARRCSTTELLPLTANLSIPGGLN